MKKYQLNKNLIVNALAIIMNYEAKLIQIIVFLIFSFFEIYCSHIGLENDCDPLSTSYRNTMLVKSITGDMTPLCVIGSANRATSSQENTAQGIQVSPLNKGFTTKNSGTDSFTVSLLKAPKETVIIPLSASISGQVAIAPNSLSFTTSNWNIPQTVTLTGLDDLAALGTFVNLVINLGPSQSQDVSSNSLNATSQTFANRDYRRIIFSTSVNTLVGGSLGGVAGADSLCNADAGKPVNTGTYKAMIAT
ncbi:hypothetical protein LPTSP3_g03610 [Leptospira kobayashii]|uniref:DUF1554 domain-containing protein n=1 Tax=Leptospira kobayashii TaxID=1917830 RepID=A0ABM7UFS4_9LEPT|nr:hypothetical protein LPTSP3_g03610 [Leptospira kobayashii]